VVSLLFAAGGFLVSAGRHNVLNRHSYIREKFLDGQTRRAKFFSQLVKCLALKENPAMLSDDANMA